jgi:S1-C subfamily serine protease
VPATREGGIPRRELSRERDRDRQDGSEEGVPQIDARGRSAEIQPRWIPPRGDWKLGVWAYNTDSGVVVTRVAPGSPAERVGIERGDRIVSVGGYQVGYVGELLYPLGFELGRHADSRGNVLLLVQNVRNRELMTLTAQLDRPGRVRPLERPAVAP